MIYTFKLILGISLLLFGFNACGGEKKQITTIENIQDDLGNTFNFESPPERVVSLAPNLTELLFDLGVGNRIVGNSIHCNYPDEAKKIRKVGDLITVDYEILTSLNPDLIFITAVGNTRDQYDKIVDLGYTVFVADPNSYAGIKNTYFQMAGIFQLESKAKVRIKMWEKTVDNIIEQSKSRRARSAMFIVSLTPIFLVGKSSFMNEYLDYCGLSNIAANSKMNYPMFSREAIIESNPDIIILFEGNDLDINSLINTYPEWSNLSAIKHDNVLFVDPDKYSRPGPRFFEALEDLNNKLNLLQN